LSCVESHRQVLSDVMWVPPIQAEQFDSIGFAAERAFAGCCQPQLEVCEVLAVAERGRRGKRLAVVGFEQPGLSLPEP
jgi:hypothetical protein